MFARLWQIRLPLVVIVLPVLLVSVYYAFIAAPIYVSQSSFVVRVSAPPSSSSFGNLLQNSGITRSQDDTFSAQEYIRSRDALQRMSDDLPIRTYFDRPEADIFARFPAPWQTGLFEELYRYFSQRVQVIHNDTTGITVLRTSAFRPAGFSTTSNISASAARTSPTEKANHAMNSQPARTRPRSANGSINPAR